MALAAMEACDRARHSSSPLSSCTACATQSAAVLPAGVGWWTRECRRYGRQCFRFGAARCRASLACLAQDGLAPVQAAQRTRDGDLETLALLVSTEAVVRLSTPAFAFGPALGFDAQRHVQPDCRAPQAVLRSQCTSGIFRCGSTSARYAGKRCTRLRPRHIRLARHCHRLRGGGRAGPGRCRSSRRVRRRR